ncbi:hypothetical protein THASP1DRAFT_22967 [Thamnocephalis sphaerospora]|uniref:RNA ligase domain-containing protein n=1 Tax=Thamnocephalis sphaerospora TaxID=78915 RepID=A0A4P9XT38_9FUNG|nr:hypothetical protein THASP1DRAFT_22967 [Thamnocephalis sphaerospora]|eukprot:RKP09152.1 hypothetical protein THASP1DRAFT_22967 [Thamnocephalis sphaerospora]
MADRLVPPTLAEGGAATIWRTGVPMGVQQLLARFAREAATTVTMAVGATAASQRPLNPNRPPVPRPTRSRERTLPTKDLEGLIKYPRTRHLLNLGAATRDDLVLAADDADRFLALHRAHADRLTVEEKLDGANIGIRLVSGWTAAMGRSPRAFRVQNRSHFVNSRDHEQFRPLDAFLYQYHDALIHLLTAHPIDAAPKEECQLVGDDIDGATVTAPDASATGRTPTAAPNERILFGEWLAARHSVAYTRLPAYFVPFDLLDTRSARFWSRRRFTALLADTDLPRVPRLPVTWPGLQVAIQGDQPTACVDTACMRDALLASLERPSAFGDTTVEGAIVRVDDAADQWLLDKVKLVRADFVAGCADGHWSRRRVDWNQVQLHAHRAGTADASVTTTLV